MILLSINPYGYLVAIIIAALAIMFYLLKKGLVERPGSQAECKSTNREEFEKSFAIPDDKLDLIRKHLKISQENFDEQFAIERKRQGEIIKTTNENPLIELNDEYDAINSKITALYGEIGRLDALSGRQVEIKILNKDIEQLSYRKEEILKILKGE